MGCLLSCETTEIETWALQLGVAVNTTAHEPQRQCVPLPDGAHSCILLRGTQAKQQVSCRPKEGNPRGGRTREKELCPWRAAGSRDIFVAWDPLLWITTKERRFLCLPWSPRYLCYIQPSQSSRYCM